MTEDEAVKELGDGEWEEVLSTVTDRKDWTPIQKEGAELFIRIGDGSQFVKYVLENGRYNFVEVLE